MCLDGEKTEAVPSGLLAKWKKLRYYIYERQNDVPAMKKLAEELLLDNERAFYPVMKSLYPAKEWPEICERLLCELERRSKFYGIYLEIIKEERMQPRLYAYCRQWPDRVSDLYSYLVPEYVDEMDILFQAYILKESTNASYRKDYAKIGEILKHYQKACGAAAARAMRDTLLAKYPCRRAFIEELSKLKI